MMRRTHFALIALIAGIAFVFLAGTGCEPGDTVPDAAADGDSTAPETDDGSAGDGGPEDGGPEDGGPEDGGGGPDADGVEPSDATDATTPGSIALGKSCGASSECAPSKNLCLVVICEGTPSICAAFPATGGPYCDDGKACTENDQCVGGVCAGDVRDCDDANPCTDDLCTEPGGCSTKINEAACEDGDPCTAEDRCLDGDCFAEPVPEGGACDGHNPCATDMTCDDAGLCQGGTPMLDGMVCEDGDPCTKSDTCSAGVCAGLLWLCDDGNSCTTDLCLPDGSCASELYVDAATPCDDGDVCSGDDACDGAGICAGTPIDNCP